MLRLPCILGNPQHRGTKSKVAASPLPSHVPKRGRKCYGLRVFSGIPKIGEQNHNCLPHPCLLAGPKEGKNAMSPLHSQGSPTPRQGVKSEVVLDIGEQNQKWAPHPCLHGCPEEGGNATSSVHFRESPTSGNKIRSGYLTPAFLRAQKRAETIRPLAFSGIPNAKCK